MTYYFSTLGSDLTGTGTISNPWGSPHFGANQLNPGDSLVGRGGTYYLPGTSDEFIYVNSKSGTAGAHIIITNYPGETPIFDCANITSNAEHNGIMLEYCSYWDITGIELINCKNRGSGAASPGLTLFDCSHINVDKSVLHDNDNGFISYNGDVIRFTNCDSYTNGVGSPYLGNNGFYARCPGSATTYFIGCRAWGNGQDGYDCFAQPGTGGGYIYWQNCWSFSNSLTYQGTGFKMGTNQAPSVSNSPQRILTNCIAADNPIGYDESQDIGVGYSIPIAIYNCISFSNTVGFNFQFSEGVGGSYYDDIIRNCISYDDGTVGYWGGVPNIVDHNSWNIRTPIESDFVNTEISQLAFSRKPDGSLPDITFMHLSSTASDFIQAGLTISGLTLDGEGKPYAVPPSIGAYEYGMITIIPVESITVTGEGGATTISTDNGTLQMYATVLPEDATNKSVTWSVIPGTGTASISSTGLLTAESDGTITVKATSNSN